MTTILDRIVRTKREEIAAAQQLRSTVQLREDLPLAPPVRDFRAALAAPGPIKLIAEVKKASPSRGIIRADFDAVGIAHCYEQHGATCLSVLTDAQYFQGRLEYLQEIRRRVALPVLRKDFILDPYQVLEARVAGADAVLLIAECLDDGQLHSLLQEVNELGMAALVEFYLPENLPRLLAAGATLLGVNNRDLHTFHTDLEHTLRMRDRIPSDRVLVSESGIRDHRDVQKLERAGVHAMLVGEHLMASPDIGQAVRRLLVGP